jgi:hypothetical protein
VKLILRLAAATLIGIVVSAAVHFAVLECIWSFHADWLAAIFLAPGILLAGRGFEAQSAVIPLNVVALAIFLAVGSFLLLTRCTLRQKK